MNLKIKMALCILLCCAAVTGASGCDVFTNSDPEATPEFSGTPIGKPIERSEAADNIFSLNYSSSNNLNPISTSSGANLMIAPLMYESFFEVDENMTVGSRLCSKWSTEDGKAYLFYVDTSVKFHDGSTLTASDVYYSIQRAMRTTKYSARLSNILGISAIGEDLVMVNLIRTNTQFPALLNIPIIKSGSIDDYAPPGTGPYKLAGDGTVLVPFDGHPDSGNLPIDAIYLKEFVGAENIILAFEDAEIDLVTNDSTGLSNLGYGSMNDKRYISTTSLHYIGFNMERHTVYRYAMTYCINRSGIVTDIMGGAGTSATLPIHPVSPLYNARFAASFEYSPEKFRAALTQFGVDDHDNDGLLEMMITGIPVEMDLTFIVNNESAVKVAAARNIVKALEDAGITVTLRELSFTDFQAALKEGDFDMYYGEVKLTPDFDLTQLLTPNGSLNYGRINDPSLTAHIENYLAAFDDERSMYADLLFQYITESAPIVPIVFEKQEVLTHHGVVTGINPTQYNVFNKITEWEIELQSMDGE